MKFFTCLLFIFALAPLFLSAEEERLSLSLTTDIAYHPKTDYVASDGTHFAPTSGPFRIVKPRTTFTAEYKIPVLRGESPLFAGNHVTLTGSLMITPVSFSPQFSVTFSPAAFFDLEAGFTTGSGWNIGSLHGVREYNPATREYDSLTSFTGWYMRPYAAATIKFDLGALWPGDWHHIVGLATFAVGYEAMLGTSRTIWEWQTFTDHADGWMYVQYYVLGYQMPIKLSMIALTFEFSGHFSASDYGAFADTYGGDYLFKEIGPMFEFTLNEKNIFYAGIFFTGQRGFKESHTDEEVEPSLTYTGTEWFWNYIAVRWVHKF